MTIPTATVEPQLPMPELGPDIHRVLIGAVVDYAIYMLDPSGRVASWNPGAEAIKGYAPEEIIGQHYSRFFTDEDRLSGRPERILNEAREQGRFVGEGWRRRKDGSRFWAMAVLDAVKDENGRLIGFAKITRDVTAQHEAQVKLQESERQFRLLVKGVTDYALYMIDPTGIVTNWNAGAEHIKGYGADEVVGKHFSTFYTPEDRAGGLPDFALNTARDKGRFESEGWRVRKDGSRFFASVVIDAIRDETGELIGFAKITRDITERRETQAKLEEAREQLFQAQKMEAIGQLTGGVAHDFNNLLTVILGGIDMARRRNHDPARRDALLDSVAEAARKGASLTRQLLAFSRRQPLNTEVVDLAVSLPEMVNLLDRSLGENIEIELDLDGRLVTEVDISQLELVVMNIGLNARDAMPHGGRFSIKARPVELTGAVGGLNGRFVALTLTDTGEGMSEDVRRRAFEPFFTTKEVGRGTGLGLSQAYGFIQQSGGAMTLDSEEGRGTRLTIYLPASSLTPDEAVETDDELLVQNLDGRRLLVVEDDPAVAAIAVDVLRDAGAEVVQVSTPADALATLARQSFDLVFSDVVMPGGRTGYDLAYEICQRHAGTPILLATGYSEAATAATQAFPLLQKPYRPDELRRAVAQALATIR